MSQDRMAVTVLGIEIGTGTGWDQSGDWSFVTYNFQPNQQFAIVCPQAVAGCSLNVDYDDGLLSSYDDDGNQLWSANAVKTLHLMLPTT